MSETSSGFGRLVGQFDDLLAELTSSLSNEWVLKDRITRGLIWRNFINLRNPAPKQGWKIHVSVAACEAPVLMRTVLPTLVRHRVSFKLPSSVEWICKINSGVIGDTQVGKIVTAYPVTTAQAVELATELDHILPESRGPVIPSDITLRKGGAVSLRYGVIIGEKPIVDSIGTLSFPLQKPDGTVTPDTRTSDGTQPDWAPKLPIEYFRAEEPNPRRPVLIDGHSFLPLALIYKTLLSSVRLGLEIEELENVILKSTASGISGDLRGFDTRDRLWNEYNVLRELSEHGGIAPRPIAFLDDDPAVLVMEDIDGISLEDLPRKKRLDLLPLFASAVARLHEIGYVHCDLKLSNCLVTNGSIRLIDFGLAARFGTRDGPMAGTPMYSPPEGIAGAITFPRDLHALGVCVAYAILDQDPAEMPDKSSRLVGLMHLAGAHRGAGIVRGLIAPDPERRTLAAEAASLLHELPDERAVGDPAPRVFTSNLGRDQWCKRASLEAGFATRNFIEATPIGHWWRNDHYFADFACEGLNLGAAGVILGLTSIDQAFNRRFFADDTNAGADWLTSEDPSPAAAGFFTGNAGVALALALTAKRNRREDLISHVRLRLEAAAVPSTEYDLFSGAAGVIWAACLISAILQERWPIEMVKNTAQSLVEKAELLQSVWVWPPSETRDKTSSGPFLGAAHGSAGIAMALAIWGHVIRDDQFIKLAIDTFKSLHRSGLAENGKTLLYELNDTRQPAAIANWCHGTAGFLWCMLQAFQDEPILSEEINWAVQALAEMPKVLAINPTYCHGLSGLLELWRIVASLPRFRAMALDRTAILVATLRLMSNRSKGQVYWCADDPRVLTPDLWIGFLAPATALALHSINYPHALLSEHWLKRCADS